MSDHKTIIVHHDLKIEQLVKEINSSHQKQVILEVPADSSVLTNEINLRLIKFYAEEEEKDIIINANDPTLIALAQRLGISTIRERELKPRMMAEAGENDSEFTQTQSAIKGRSQSKPLQRRTTLVNGGLFSAILVAFFSFILAFWWFVQPKAKIIVYPKEQNLNFRAQVNLIPNQNKIDLVNGRIDGKIFDRLLDLDVRTVATGYKVIGITPAIGEVTLINSTNQPVVLPKGVVFTGRENIRFISQKEVLVPKKATKYQQGVPVGEEYGKAEVPVQAQQIGTIGNQPVKSITQVEGRYQRFLKIINLKPTRNGADKRISVVMLEDVKKGETEARSQMTLSGPEEAIKLVGRDFLFLPELVNLEVISVKNNPEIGKEATSVTTHLEYKVTVLTPSKADVHKYLLSQLEKNIPPDFSSKNNEVKLISAKASMNSNNQIQLELLGRGIIRGVLKQAKIRELIKGKTLAEAKELLIKQNEVANFQIDMPNHRKKLPGYSFQIKVILPTEPKGN